MKDLASWRFFAAMFDNQPLPNVSIKDLLSEMPARLMGGEHIPAAIIEAAERDGYVNDITVMCNNPKQFYIGMTMMANASSSS